MRGLRHVVHHDILDALRAEFFGNGFGKLFGIAIHRAVCDNHAFLAFVPAQAVVQVNHLRNLLGPYRPVGRANHPDVQPLAFLQRLLHRIAKLAHDVRVIAAHLTFVDFGIDVLVDASAVQRAEATERVAREEDAFGLIESDHGFGPMHHRNQVEAQVVVSQFQEITFAHHVTVSAYAVETFHHVECLLVAHQHDVGIILLNQSD